MKTNDQSSVGGASGAASPKAAPPLVGADYDLTGYMAELAEFDISEEEKIELLQTLWSILTILVDLNVDVHNLDGVLDPGGAANPDAVTSSFNDQAMTEKASGT